jgi:hypothetical protein
MGRAAAARTGKADLAGLGLGLGDQILDRLERQAGVDQQHQWQLGNHAHRRKGGVGVVRHFFVQRRVDRLRAHVAHQQGVAVWPGLGHHVGAQHAGRAAFVVNDDRLAPLHRQLLRHQAGPHIGAATRRKRHNDGNGAAGVSGRAVGLGLRGCEGSKGQKDGCRDQVGHARVCQ